MQDNTLQEIKDRLNITDVIGGYIQLKKAGVNHKAVCPFHSEKSASLVVSPQKQIWHCFGCQEGGDIFGFVMRYENLDFKEALKTLAQKAGIKLPQYRTSQSQSPDNKEQLIRINNFAAELYHQLLLKDRLGQTARDYLRERGLTSSTITKWKIGFAPNEFHFLQSALIKKNVSEKDMLDAGILAKNERGQVYDRFRGRITFPIFNYFGESVGFSARILQDDGKSAKYINSPQTSVYDKSRILYGFNYAKEAIRKQDEAVVVEGQMDVIACHQAGFENVVASSGTALTLIQANLLLRLTRNLKFCFDSDSAGALAARRAVEELINLPAAIKIVELKDAKDPDELIKKNPQAFLTALQEAPLYLDFLFEKSFNNYNPSLAQDKKRVGEELLPLISRLSDPLEKEHYLERFSRYSGATLTAVGLALQKYEKQDKKFPPQKKLEIISQSSIMLTDPLEKAILGGMLIFPQLLQMGKNQNIDKDFFSSKVSLLAGKLFAGETPEELIKKDTLTAEAAFVAEALSNELQSQEKYFKQWMKDLARVKVKVLKKRLESINFEIRQAESKKNNELLKQLRDQFALISSKRAEYEKQE